MNAQPENAPVNGSMVTFLLHDEDGERYRVGEVVGPVEEDPQTGEIWVGVRVWHAPPHRALSLIPLTTVLNIAPPNEGDRAA